MRVCVYVCVQIYLQNKQGVVRYSPKLITPAQICEAIEDMGFDAEVCQEGVKDRTSCETIAIEGMTCQSCVATIENQIGCYTGIQSIKVGSATRAF